MKYEEIKTIASILVISLLLAFLGTLFLYGISTNKFTGFIVSGEENIPGATLEEKATIYEAIKAIDDSEQIILNMLEKNLPTSYMNDTLIEAKRVFEQAKYAEILRGNVEATRQETTDARTALNLLNWKEIYYNDVLIYTRDIKLREEKAYLILDKLSVEKVKQEENTKISEITKEILNNAEIAFNNDRYNEAEELIEEYKLSVEKDNLDASRFSGISDGAKNFFQRYWIYLIILLAIVFVAFYFLEKKLKNDRLKKRLRKLRIEKAVILQLMKKTQIERYRENKISGLVYNIRIKKYDERSKEIDLLIPVIEKELKNKENSKTKKISDKTTREHKRISKPKKIKIKKNKTKIKSHKKNEKQEKKLHRSVYPKTQNKGAKK